MPFYDRTEILLGKAGLEKLKNSKVCVFGLGGVGAAAAMDLVRAGTGCLVVVDFDIVDESNLNRLYFGYANNIGSPKTEVFTAYAKEVNPEVVIDSKVSLIRSADAASVIPPGCNFYLDCIDTLNPKVRLLAALARELKPFASSMGTSGRLAPERLKLGSLWDSSGCPLASAVRTRLRRLGFASVHAKGKEALGTGVRLLHDFPCVWSDERPVPPLEASGTRTGEMRDGIRIRAIQGSGPFVPQAAGHILASMAIRSLLGVSFP